MWHAGGGAGLGMTFLEDGGRVTLGQVPLLGAGLAGLAFCGAKVCQAGVRTRMVTSGASG